MAGNAQHLWDDSFALQIPALDIHLKNLFDLAYELDCAIEAGNEEQVIEQTIQRLKEHCQGHFVTQENLLHEYGYPEVHAHAIQHDRFTRTLLDFESQWQAGAGGVPLRLAAFLKKWMASHIAVEDKKTLPYMLKGTPETGTDSSPQKKRKTALGIGSKGTAADSTASSFRPGPSASSAVDEAGEMRPGVGTRGVPVFVEVGAATKHPDTAICARVSNCLMKQHIPFVSSAHSLDKLRATLKEMESSGRPPTIFIVNTYGARDILVELDSLMGDLPVLFLRRALHAGQSGLLAQTRLLAPGTSPTLTAATLGQMRPRLTSIWFYGSKNSAIIAQRAAEAITAFLKTGDFRHIERANPAARGK